ncbi:NPC intracellular cholesterol transporter 2 homolog a-like [Watersipora subatra]|uniref:NPC intracellular cholesterol transporter 2 homolog a-like n=1 Tax=Watersipora subatra TaxID=2589382 RepID=UPI00355B8279
MQSQLVFCVVIVILAVVSAGSLPLKDCGSKAGKVTSISLDPPPVGSCTFPRGKNVTATLNLEIDEATSKLTVKCKGDVVVWVNFPLPNNDACSQGVTCPTTSGSSYTFKTVIPILHEYPSLRLVVQLEFQDDNGQDAICVQFPGEIC